MNIVDHIKNVERFSQGNAKAIANAMNTSIRSTRSYISKQIKAEQKFSFPSKYIKIRKATPTVIQGSLWINTKKVLSHKFFGAKQNSKGVTFRKPYTHGSYQIQKSYPSAFIPKTTNKIENTGMMVFQRESDARYPIKLVAQTPPITEMVEAVDSFKVRIHYTETFKKRYQYEQERIAKKFLQANVPIINNLHIKL